MGPENRVKGFLLVAPTLVGGSSARTLEKHLGKSNGYDESAVGYTLAAEGLEGEAASIPTGQLGEPMTVQSGTNAPATIGEFDYTGHALDQMQARGLVPSVVEDTIANGAVSSGREGAIVYATDQSQGRR